MRVITGTARGRRLREPEGLDIRPTTDRVKEGLFSALQFEIEGRRVLDLFAGTGQLGIECLSRGASRCVFVEAGRTALDVVRENLASTGLGGRARVVPGDALAFLSRTEDRFDLIFLDPPYASPLLEQALEAVAARGILAPGGVIAAEHPAAKSLPLPPGGIRPGRTYRYGRIAVSLYRRDAAGEPQKPDDAGEPQETDAAGELRKPDTAVRPEEPYTAGEPQETDAAERPPARLP